MVFVGGATAGLLVTDPAAERVRATKDVDAIVEAQRADFHRVEERVAALGFVRDVASDVMCRWIHRESGVLFDLMPVDARVLGFSNRWYAYAIETAESIELGDGIMIRAVSAPAFVATKLEAFIQRGHGDILGNHDLEDVLNIVDGREELGHGDRSGETAAFRPLSVSMVRRMRAPRPTRPTRRDDRASAGPSRDGASRSGP